jgi:hypothetical protein
LRRPAIIGGDTTNAKYILCDIRGPLRLRLRGLCRGSVSDIPRYLTRFFHANCGSKVAIRDKPAAPITSDFAFTVAFEPGAEIEDRFELALRLPVPLQSRHWLVSSWSMVSKFIAL